MYSKTRFALILEGLSRGLFDRLVSQHESDKFNKGFRSWDHLVSMVFSQLSGCRSLREIEFGFNGQSEHHYHLGTRSIKRSTLSEANARRKSGLFADLCGELIYMAHRELRRDVRDFLYLLDSSPIHLQGLGYDDWAYPNRNNVSQGIKLHMMIEAKGASPSFIQLTDAKVSDIKIGRTIPIEQGMTYVFDKGYYDFNWWYRMDQKGATFVTRFKKNVAVKTESLREIPEPDKQVIIEDAVVSLKSRFVKGKSTTKGCEKNQYCGVAIRRVTVDRPDKETPLILVTNDFERSAIEIAELYKKRWGIELFFKWIKQNLKIKRFLGRSKNAVEIQIYSAIIAYVLVQIHFRKHDINQTLSLFLTTIKVGLFQRMNTAYEIDRRRRQTLAEINERQAVLCL